MSSISPVPASSPVVAPTSAAVPNTHAAASASVSANTSAGLSVDAGVVATISTPSAPVNGTAALYTNLAKLATDISGTGINPAPADINLKWAAAVAKNPSMATVAEQLAANQALMNAMA